MGRCLLIFSAGPGQSLVGLFGLFGLFTRPEQKQPESK
jgi:hypothetical protein